MSSPSLKAAFIGAGPRSRSAHYPNVARLPDVAMASVCELDEERLDMVVDAYGFSEVFTHHQEMLERANPDIVYCVMNEQWALNPVLDCLNAGKHLFIEKPPGANMDEVTQIRDAAVANGVWCQVGFQRRHAAVIQESMRRAQARGPVSMAAGIFHKQLLGEAAGGFTTTLWNDICHIVDLVRYMAGSEPAAVKAHRARFSSPHWNVYNALIEFDNDATGMLLAVRASGGRILGAELHTAGLGCYIDIPRQVTFLEDDTRRETVSGWQIADAGQKDTAAYDGTLAMHQHFIECIRTGHQPLTDIRDTIHSMQLVADIEGDK